MNIPDAGLTAALAGAVGSLAAAIGYAVKEMVNTRKAQLAHEWELERVKQKHVLELEQKRADRDELVASTIGKTIDALHRIEDGLKAQTEAILSGPRSSDLRASFKEASDNLAQHHDEIVSRIDKLEDILSELRELLKAIRDFVSSQHSG